LTAPPALTRATSPRALESIPAAPRAEASQSLSRPSLSSVPVALAGLWLAGALLLSARWLAAYLMLRRRLRPRPQVLEAPMVSILGELRERAGLEDHVRLTCSSRLPVPVALGLRRQEICVPPRALVGLAPEQQEGMLAHELAHLVRRDPFWLAFGRVLASVFFFQPLNWIAVRRLREISELLCDEWAVGRTGRPVSLARCLAEVAGWSFVPLGSLTAPGMADRPSHLGVRIRRLLEEARSPQRRVHPALLAAGMVVLVVAVAAAAPGVQAAVAADRDQRGQEAAEAPDPEEAPELAELAELDDLDDADDQGDLDDLDSLEDLEDLEMDAEVLAAEIEGEIVGETAAVVAGEVTDEIFGGTFGETLGDLSTVSAQLAMDLSDDLMGTVSEDAKENEELAIRYKELSERVSRQIDDRLKEQMKALEKAVEMSLSQVEKSEEIRQLERRAQEIVERARPSEQEMARLRAEVDKLRAEGGMSEVDKLRIREESKRLAQQNRLTDKDRAELDVIRRQAHEIAQRSLGTNKAEIDRMRQQIQQEAQALREEIQRQFDSDPKLRELRDQRIQERERRRQERERERRERAPRPPRPERQVQMHVAPEVQVRVEPAVVAAATRVDVKVDPVVAPKAIRPRVDVKVRPAVAPKAEAHVDVRVEPAIAPKAEAPEPPGR
jgi:beta-lactamase regulating signal transducer with metallopeptidase domain